MRKKIIEYVLTQVGVDLEKYRTEFTRGFERQGEIIVEYREIPRTDWRNVELLSRMENSHICIETVGAWGKMIAYR